MASELPLIRIFVSSPGDVAHERRTARTVFDRLRAEFADQVRIEPYFWEYEPLEFSKSFQANIPSTAEFDVVVCFLWTRLGSKLHSGLKLPDGSEARSGTEYEIAYALAEQERRGAPELHVWINETEPTIPLEPAELRRERIAQWDALKEFLAARTRDAQDGSFIGSYTGYRTLDEFEELFEVKIRKILARRLGDDAAPGKLRRTWTGDSPYRGLEAFEVEHAPLFFGRTRAIGDALHLVRRSLVDARDPRGFLLLLGASGSGKSSLARAGIVPALMEPGSIDGVALWRRAVLRPSDAVGDPVDALARALLADAALPELRDPIGIEGMVGGLTAKPDMIVGEMRGLLRQIAAEHRQVEIAAIERRIASLATERREEDAAVLRRTAATLRMPQCRLVILVDQFEELFTTGTPEDQRTRFVAALAALARSGSVVVLVTMRSDFGARLDELPTMLDLAAGTGTLHIGPPTATQLAQMIRMPAQAAGMPFEDHPDLGRLDERIREDAGKGISLPLVEYALDELYRAGSKDGVLTHDRYEALGGLSGAIASRAEATFAGLSVASQRAFEGLLKLLVTVGDGDDVVVTRKTLCPDDVALAPESTLLIRALVDARLLTADKDASGRNTVRIAHEALLFGWQRIGLWIESNKSFLRRRAAFERKVADYVASGKREDWLLQGLPLADAEGLLTEAPEVFDAQSKAFVATSRNRTDQEIRRRKRARQVVLGLSFGSLIAILALTVWFLHGLRVANVKMESANQKTTEQLAKTKYELERAETEESRMWLERAAASAAKNDHFTAAMMAARSIGFVGWGRPKLEEGAFPLLAGAESKYFAVERTRIRSAAAEYLRRNYYAPIWSAPIDTDIEAEPLKLLAFGNSSLVAVLCKKRINVWNAESGKALDSIELRGELAAYGPSADRSCLYVTTKTNEVIQLDGVSGRGRYVTVDFQGGMPESIASSPDSRSLALLLSDGWRKRIQIFDASTFTGIRTLPCDKSVEILKFAGDGRKLFGATSTGGVFSYDPEGNHPHETEMRKFEGPTGRSKIVCMSEDGRILVRELEEKKIEVLELSSDRKSVIDDPDSNRRLDEWSSTCGLLARLDGERRLTLWNPIERIQIGQIETIAFCTRLAISPNEQMISVANDSGVELWNRKDGSRLKLFGAKPHEIKSMAFTNDNQIVLALCASGQVKALTPKGDSKQSEYQESGRVRDVSASSTGLAVTASDEGCSVWDLTDGRRVSKTETSNVTHVEMAWDGTIYGAIESPNGLVFRSTASGDRVGNIKSEILDFSISRDASFVAVITKDRFVRLHRIPSGDLAAEIGKITSNDDEIVVSPNGQVAATFGADEWVTIWDLSQPKVLSRSEEFKPKKEKPSLDSKFFSWGEIRPHVVCAVFSSDNSLLATSNNQGGVKIWDVLFMEERMAWGADVRLHSVQFSPDDSLLVAVDEHGDVRLWDVGTGTELHRISGSFESAEFCGGPNRLLLRDSSGGITLWDSLAPEVRVLRGALEREENDSAARGRAGLIELRGPHSRNKNYSFQLGVSGDGRTLASYHADGFLDVWDLVSAERCASFRVFERPIHIDVLALDSRLTRMAVGRATGAIDFIDMANGRVESALVSHPDAVSGIAVDPKGLLFVSASRSKLLCWSHSGSVIWMRDASTPNIEGVSRLLIDPTSRYLVSAHDGDQYEIAVWDLATGSTLYRIRTDEKIGDICISPSGNRFAYSCLGGDHVVVCELPTGRPVSGIRIPPEPGAANDALGLDYHPDGQRIVVATRKGRLFVLDTSSGDVLLIQEGKNDLIGARFALSGNAIAVGSADSSVILFDYGEHATNAASQQQFFEVFNQMPFRKEFGKKLAPLTASSLFAADEFAVRHRRSDTFVRLSRPWNSVDDECRLRLQQAFRNRQWRMAVASWADARARNLFPADDPARFTYCIMLTGRLRSFVETLPKDGHRHHPDLIVLAKELCAALTEEAARDVGVSLSLHTLAKALQSMPEGTSLGAATDPISTLLDTCKRLYPKAPEFSDAANRVARTSFPK